MGCDAFKCSSLLCKGEIVDEFVSTFSMLSSSSVVEDPLAFLSSIELPHC